MGFNVWVYSRADQDIVYNKPLGSDGTVYLRWYQPAHRLGLPLIGSIYHDGLSVEGPQMAALSQELDILETFWDRAFIRTGPLDFATTDVDMVWLREESDRRIGYFREAIRMAQECGGILHVS